MKRLKKIKITLLFILFIFSINSFSQFSKTHYIPPIGTQGQGSGTPQIQYMYISTPNENPIDVIITPIGGEPITVSISNSSPYEYLVSSIDQFYDQYELVELMEKNKFSNVEFRNLSNGISAIHSGWKI